LVDGRHAEVEGKKNGTYVGPTVIDFVKPDMAIAKEEIFGPVISIMRTDTLDEALAIENANPYGNAASVFTQNGGYARYVMEKASAGMIGVNVGVPVPREPFSFGGWNESRFGVGDITGKSSIEFWTKLKKSTIKWNPRRDKLDELSLNRDFTVIQKHFMSTIFAQSEAKQIIRDNLDYTLFFLEPNRKTCIRLL